MCTHQGIGHGALRRQAVEGAHGGKLLGVQEGDDGVHAAVPPATFLHERKVLQVCGGWGG